MTPDVDAIAETPRFSLLGGPLHRLGRRLGLVRGESNSAPFGLALGLFLWGVAMLLGFVGGRGADLLTLPSIGAHVRLLVGIPMLFLAEAWVGPRWTTFVDTIVRSGVVPPRTVPALAAEVDRARRWTESWIPDAVCLVLAAIAATFGSMLPIPGATGAFDPARSGMTLWGAWYWVVCMTIFRFLLLRWLWRLATWALFLRRVTKLELDLVPTHPDGAAGLGYLEVVHTHFIPLSFAVSAVVSASYAEEIATGQVTLEASGPILALALAIQGVLLLGPLFLVTPKLWTCRVRGLSDYMEFASDYVGRFDRKWLRGAPPPGEPLLGTSDLQSLADLGNSVRVINGMRWVPISLELLRDLGVAAVAPILPLLLLEYPIAELTRKLLDRMIGP